MISRRGFVGAGAAIFAARAFAEEWKAPEKNDVKGGFDEAAADQDCAAPWQPYSDRKVKVGIAGEGVCNFGSAFGYQNHPNVEVVACTDLDPEKRRLLQERTGAKKAYPSCEEMIAHAAEDRLEAVYIATDAPSHARLSILALEHGLHVERNQCTARQFLGGERSAGRVGLAELLRIDGIHFAEEAHLLQQHGGLDHIVERGTGIGQDIAHILNHLFGLFLQCSGHFTRFGIHRQLSRHENLVPATDGVAVGPDFGQRFLGSDFLFHLLECSLRYILKKTAVGL